MIFNNLYIPQSCPLYYLVPLCLVHYYDVWLHSVLRTKCYYTLAGISQYVLLFFIIVMCFYLLNYQQNF